MSIRRVEKIDYAALTDIQTFIGDVAIDTLEDEQTKGWPRDDDQFTTLVDSKQQSNSHNVYHVKEWGRIDYILQTNLLEIAIFVLDNLIKESPLGSGSDADRSGRYHSAHQVIFNGQLVKPGQLANMIKNPPNNMGKSDELLIVNTQPYAMKIERGESMQTPKGVYKRVSNMTKRRFGKVAFISQRNLTSSQIPGVATRTVTKRKGTKGGQAQQVAALYPAIRIRRGRGTV